MAKKAAGVGGRMARAAMQTMVLDICVEKDHPAVTAHHAMAMKPAVIDVPKDRLAATVHLAVMALAINNITNKTDRTRPPQVPINHTRPARPPKNPKRKKAPTSPPPPFDLSS
jgi:hypothetical protein